METKDREQEELERCLRRFRPPMPPEGLQQRVLAGASRPTPWLAALYVAAVALISITLPINTWIERVDAEPKTQEPYVTIQLLREELERS